MATQSLQDLAESFALFPDWEDRYRYLIDLGKRIPAMDNSLKIEENKVQGCISQVWLVAEWVDGKLRFQANSDSEIVQGLIYLLALAYQGKTPREIEAFEINKVFADLGFDRHILPNRRNGFVAMVERIKSLARAVSA